MNKAQENLEQRINKKAQRNTSKRVVTTKSFNNTNHDFVPDARHQRNPDAILFQQLKKRKVLSVTTTFKQWQDEKMRVVIKGLGKAPKPADPKPAQAPSQKTIKKSVANKIRSLVKKI